MDFTFLQLFIDYWPLVLFLSFGGWLIRRGNARRLQDNSARNRAAARQHGLGYSAPGSASADPGLIHGNHQFTGETRGVAWTLDVTRLQSEIDDGLVTRSDVSICYTRWTATQVRTSGGSLVLMTLPEEARPAQAKEPGGDLLADLASRAAWGALQLYFRGAFGAERVRNLELGPEHHLPLPAVLSGAKWVAFGNDPALLARFSPEILAHLRDAPPGPAALLWDAQGLSLSWPRELLRPDAIADCVEHCVVLLSLITSRDRQ